MKIKLLVLISLVFLSLHGFAQSISGKITSATDNSALPGASITLNNAPVGTSTDANGNYTLSGLPTGKTITIVISSIGFRTKEEIISVKSGENKVLNFVLSEDDKTLEEVVVTGLSIKAKQNELGTSRAAVNSNVIESLPAPTVENALVGRLSGVEAFSTDGAPGGGFRFRIRGANSISNASDPLVIIDGIIVDNAGRNAVTGATGGGNATGSATFGMQNGTRGLSSLNPEDIESIEVLKGAAAASLYGSRAAAGVIVVTTKKGKGKLSVDYSLDFGNTQVSRGVADYKMDWTASEIDQWTALVNPTKTIYKDADIAAYKNNKLTDYTMEPFRKGTFRRNTIRLQGGTKWLGYYVSGNLQNTVGHIKGTDYETKGALIGLTSSPIAGLNVRLNYNIQNSDRNQIASGTPGFFVPNRWAVDATAMPFMNYDNQPSTGTATDVGAVKNNVTGIKFLDDYARLQKNLLTNRTLLSGNINYKILGNLSIDLTGGIDKSKSDGQILYPVGLVSLFPTGRLDQDLEEISQKTFTVGLNHSWKINEKMYLKSAAGTQYDENERFYDYTRYQTIIAGKDPRDTLSYSAPQRAQFFQVQPIVKTLGIYFNETFGFNEKIFLNFGGRFDRSTSYINKFFFYPRASLSYQVMPSIKLRAAYGISGTQPSPYLSTLTFRNVAGGYNGSGSNYVPNNPPNDGLTPETQKEFEIGFEGSVFKNRVNFEFTYYNKQFNDLLLSTFINPALNYGLVTGVRNVGSMYNRGIEFSVGTDIIKTKDLTWNLRATGFTLDNKVTFMPDPKTPLPGGIDNIVQIREDYPISGIWSGNPFSLAPTDAARAFLGTTLPKFEGNITTTFDWKGIQLSALIGGKSGYYKYNQTARDMANPTKRMHASYWNLPTADLTTLYNNQANWVQKADFLKLRQLNLNYNVPKKILEKTKAIKKANIGLTGTNLFTWSKYTGAYDIEAETNGSTGANAAWAWTRGIDSWDAGIPKTYTLSLNIGF
jgi:TonB-dependent starch-binding outer membrane protein SusC